MRRAMAQRMDRIIAAIEGIAAFFVGVVAADILRLIIPIAFPAIARWLPGQM